MYLEIATDLLAAEVPDAARRARRRRSGVARADARRAAVAALDAAERPLIWAGGGARDAGDAVARLAERARRAGPHDLRRGGHAAARATRAASGCRRTSRPPAALWDEADVVIAIGSDLDGVQTQNFAQPQPRRR